jgi:hypothetical protein
MVLVLVLIPVVLIGEIFFLDLPGWNRRGAITLVYTLGEWIRVQRRFRHVESTHIGGIQGIDYRPMATGEDITVEPICSSSSS